MKVFTLFMTVLMLLTGFDLCKDAEGEINKSKTELRTAQSNPDSEDFPCTPFCNCARCPFSVLVPNTTADLSINSIIIKKFLGPLSGVPIEITNSVWQPPKFV